MNNFSNIIGHGEFDVSLVKYKNKNVIKKAVKNKFDYVSEKRLYLQMSKQAGFSHMNFIDENIIIPKIINTGITDLKYYFTMEYYNSYNYIEFFELNDYKFLLKRLNNLINFIETNIKYSLNIHKFDHTKMFFDKYDDIKLKLWGDFDFTLVDKIFNNIKKINVPHGQNHGDLTFSNILFGRNGKNIILIDFLDCFIESPLNDIIKLRQDTKHKWIYNVYNSNVDKIRMNILFDKMDNIIHKTFSKYDFYIENEKYFSILNLLRILPYAKTDKIKNYIKNELKEKYEV